MIMSSCNIVVLVSSVVRCGNSWRLLGGREHESWNTDPAAAIEAAFAHRAEGKSVIIRPNFNESDHGDARTQPISKCFYREWRSFNGGKFSEVRFFPGTDRNPTSTEVEDDALTASLPPIPEN
jgi:hypothetical protein